MCKLCDDGYPQDHAESPGGSRRDFLKASTCSVRAPRDRVCSRRAPSQRATTTMMTRPGHGRHGRRYVSGRPRHVRWTRQWATSPRPTCCRGQEDPRRRAEPARSRAGTIERGAYRHARLRRYASSPVRDGAAQLPRGRSVVQRWPAARRDQLFPVHSRTFAPVYRPQDVYISELFGSLSQLDAGVTTSTISRRSITRPSTPTPRSRAAPTPGDASSSLFRGRESRSGGSPPGASYPQDARRIKKQYFSPATSS